MAGASSSYLQRRLWSRSDTRLWTLNFFIGTCALYASRVALPICVVAMAHEYEWNKTDSGIILSSFFWGYAITQLFAGSLADFLGGERILPLSTAIWSVLTLVTPQLFDFAYWSGFPLSVLLLVRILTGVGQGFHMPCMASIVSRHLTAADKGRVFGICLSGSHLGTVVAGGVGSLVVGWLGWRSLFLFSGIISLVWCAHLRWVVLYRRKNYRPKTNLNEVNKQCCFDSNQINYSFQQHNDQISYQPPNSGNDHWSSASDNDESCLLHSDKISLDNSADHENEHPNLLVPNNLSAKIVPATTKIEIISSSTGEDRKYSLSTLRWRLLFNHPAFWAAAIAQYTGANCYYTLFSWLPSYFSDSFPHSPAIIYNVVPSLAIVLTSSMAPLLAARFLFHGYSMTFTRRAMESISLISMGICLLVVLSIPKDGAGFYWNVFIFTTAMAGRGFHHGGVAVNPHDLAPNHTGSVFGIFNAFSAVTGFIGVYFAGWVLQLSSNNWSYIFLLTSIQCFIGAAIYAKFGTGKRIV